MRLCVCTSVCVCVSLVDVVIVVHFHLVTGGVVVASWLSFYVSTGPFSLLWMAPGPHQLDPTFCERSPDAFRVGGWSHPPPPLSPPSSYFAFFLDFFRPFLFLSFRSANIRIKYSGPWVDFWAPPPLPPRHGRIFTSSFSSSSFC